MKGGENKMQKTQNFCLNKPEGGDPLRLADFNQNADIIDGALSNLNTAMGQIAVPKIAVGTYKGTGQNASQTITLGFRPKAVIAWGNCSTLLQADNYSFSAMAVDGAPFTRALEITNTGFIAISEGNYALSQYYPNLNDSGLAYLYLAIG